MAEPDLLKETVRQGANRLCTSGGGGLATSIAGLVGASVGCWLGALWGGLAGGAIGAVAGGVGALIVALAGGCVGALREQRNHARGEVARMLAPSVLLHFSEHCGWRPWVSGTTRVGGKVIKTDYWGALLILDMTFNSQSAQRVELVLSLRFVMDGDVQPDGADPIPMAFGFDGHGNLAEIRVNIDPHGHESLSASAGLSMDGVPDADAADHFSRGSTSLIVRDALQPDKPPVVVPVKAGDSQWF